MTIINTVGGPAPKPIYVEAVEDTPSTLPHTYQPSEGYDYLSSVTVGADPNLQAGNIKQGVSIFGVEGTLEGGTSLGDYIGYTNLPGGVMQGVTLTSTGTLGSQIVHQTATLYLLGSMYSNMTMFPGITSSNLFSQTLTYYEDIPAGTYDLWNFDAGSNYNATWNNLIQQMGMTAPCDVHCRGFICAGEYILPSDIPEMLFDATVHVESTSASITLDAPARVEGYNTGGMEVTFVPMIVYKS